MNIAENVYLYPELNTLCGFTDDEVGALLSQLHTDGMPDAQVMMRDWYNGYRFALGAEEKVYNPTLVLYFLKHLQRTGASPRQMLDSNLAADEGKLDYLAKVYLYYFGMLTLEKEETRERTLELVVPNAVMHGLYVERIREILLPSGGP